MTAKTARIEPMHDTRSANHTLVNVLDSLSTQGAVVRALALRALQQRFGRENIGYLWVIGEPMMLASVVTILHSVVSKRGSGEVSPFTFMLTGYTIYIIFRNSFNRSESALHEAQTLLYHGMITPFDIVLANWMIDVIGCISALVILQGVGIMLGLSDLPARPLYLFGAIVLFAWFSLALSLVVAAYGYRVPLVGRLAHPFSYFSLPVSGAFITISILPKWTHPFMAWNPMASVFEMARYGQFVSSPDKYIYLNYVICVNVALTYWGLLEIRRVRSQIHVA
jgi:capsular polysaccharide transport system permease protein